MKKLFSKSELLLGRGCYSRERINELFPTDKEISIKEILSVGSVNIKDKRWFVYHSCELSLAEKKELCVRLAYVVLPIYEEKYPNDNRVRECLAAIQLFRNGKTTSSELMKKRAAAYAAYAAAYDDADAAAAAAYAATAAAAADADAAAYNDAAAAAAATAAADETYSGRLQIALISFFNN